MLAHCRNDPRQRPNQCGALQIVGAEPNSPQNKGKRKVRSPLALAVVVIVVGFLFVKDWQSANGLRLAPTTSTSISAAARRTIEQRASDPNLLLKLFSDDETRANSLPIQEWRKRYMTECRKNNTQAYLKTKMSSLFTSAINQTAAPILPRSKISHDDMVEPCTHTFLDLGANIGDTVAHVIDAGVPFCGDTERTGLHQRYNANLGLMTEVYKYLHWNRLAAWFRGQLLTVSGRPSDEVTASPLSLNPEDFCVFSFEGNPAFTAQLKELEHRVMATVPRPVRRTYFFTESVVSATSGPTTLYLDTVNKKGNFDGSSLISDMFSMEKVKALNDGKVEEAHVMGYSLEQILKLTVKPSAKSHVMIKMDVEGVEYAVLNNGAQYLCDLVEKHGVYVGLVVELHEKKRVTEHTIRYYKDTESKLQGCGVNFNKGDGG